MVGEQALGHSADQAAHAAEQCEWLFVHYGDAPLRGSERCLLNLLQARAAAGLKARTALWCNQNNLAEAAAPLVDEVLVSRFPLGPGFAASPGSPFRAWLGLVHEGMALLRRRGVQLAYCNGLAPCQWMLPATLFCGRPLLVQLHTNYLPLARLASGAYAASHITGVSDFCTRDFVADGVSPARLSVVANGIDPPIVQTSREALRARLGIAPQTLLLASIGALVDWKRVDLLLSALQTLPAADRDRLHLLVVGDGPLMPVLQAQAQDLPVSFTSWRTDVGDLLNAADAVVSAATKEAFGLTLIEAAALARPALVARAGGMPEVVLDGQTGRLFEAGSASACAMALQAWLAQPEQLARLGQAAQARYRQHYTAAQMSRQLTALGTSVVQAHRPGVGSSLQRLGWLLRLALQAIWRRLRG